jgi:hypothetical protein
LTVDELCQLHQFFVWCGAEGIQRVNDVRCLKDACREAFEGAPTAPSATHQ